MARSKIQSLQLQKPQRGGSLSSSVAPGHTHHQSGKSRTPPSGALSRLASLATHLKQACKPEAASSDDSSEELMEPGEYASSSDGRDYVVNLLMPWSP